MIYLLRHGLDDEKYVGGWSDVSLLDEGKMQILVTLKEMQEKKIVPKRIITSDIKRAVETSQIVSEYFNIPFKTSDIFREQDKGILNGMLKSDALINYPEYFKDVQIDTIYPDGESLIDLYNRMKISLEYVLSLEDDTLIVTHRGVINMFYYLLKEIDLDMEKTRFDVTHASLHEIDKELKLIRKVI